jgi:hypothetical protein
MSNESFLSRKEAADYLLKNYGSPGAVTAKTLAKLAVIGGGPEFHHFGRKVAYTPHALDDWASSRCSVARRSTSDIGEAA